MTVWQMKGQPAWDCNDYSRDFEWLGISRETPKMTNQLDLNFDENDRTYSEQAAFETEVISDLKECIEDFLSFASLEELLQLIVKEIG